MAIAVHCSNGHQLRTDERYAGRKVQCPVCGDRLTIPSTERPELTDTGAMRLLGTFEPSVRPTTDSGPRYRPCSKCGAMMPALSRICNHCGVYSA